MKPSSASLVVNALKKNEIRLITVLPDSWMLEVYELISKDSYFKVIPVTHEAEGVCICAGAWCAGLRAAIVMENSGLRSATEALGRLYCFPVLLLMSFRGDIGDRAFFGRPIGRTTEPILHALEIPYVTVRKEADIEVAVRDITQTFDTALGAVALLFPGDRTMKRIDCLKLLAPQIQDQLVVVTLGVTEQEWDMVKPRDGNLLLSGMGTVTPFGLGVALGLPHRRVVVLESDGSLLFGLNSLATVAMQKPDNLTIIVFDNECYESIGGAPSHTAAGADLAGIAREAGIQDAASVSELDAFSRETEQRLTENKLSLLVAKIEPSIADVPPRYYHLFEERNRFVRYIEETEKISVLRPTKFIRRDPTKWGKE